MDSVTVEASLSPRAEHARLVEATSRALHEAVELEAVFSVTLRSVVPALADLAVLALDETPGGSRLEVAHERPDLVPRLRQEVAASLNQIRSAARSNSREGQYSCLIPTVTDSSHFGSSSDGRLMGLLRSFDVRSLIVVGLRASGRTIGGLALARSKPEPFLAADFATAQVLGHRIALALESVMLEENLEVEVDQRSRVGEAMHKWIRVFDLAWWGAAIVDGTDRRIDTVNPAFARLHGYPEPANLAGRLFTDLLPPDRAGEPEEWPSGTEKRGTEGNAYETVHVRADGTTVPVLVSATPLNEGLHPGSYVVTVQDLTDLKRTEERLQRAQRMEAVGRLAGGVAHEVNNMMTIILGFSDLLSRGLGAPDDRQREVEEIRKAAIRAAKITTQLLAFSRQQPLLAGDLRLNPIVEEMVPVLRLMLPANVRVGTSLALLDVVVRADRSQLEQVLINLAFNARDAMTSGGTIKITTESRRLDEAAGRRLIGIPIPAGQYGLVSVMDTGHGMDRSTLAQVFEPFFTTKPVGSGTGLGLSTVYGIVKQSGGYVWVESDPGRGTSFTVCLPEVSGRGAESGEEPPETQMVRGHGGTVLILEDEDGVRELAARILLERGYQVVQARNGNEALAALRDETSNPCLLLTDVIVPDMGTGELEGEVHALRPDLPILYMSGYPRDDILDRGLLRKDQPFVQKPFSSQDLASEVGRMIPRS
jgi:two-component system, cell cycle sensor histidine kinase and response regulator CckA